MLRVLFHLLLWMFFAAGPLFSQIKSTAGNILLDIDNDGNAEAFISIDGLGIGVSSPSKNLHVAGNVYVSENLSIGTSSTLSTLYIGDSFGYSIETVSDNTTLSGNSSILADASNGDITLTLPEASLVTGRIFDIKKISLSNNVFIESGSGENIDTTNTYTLGYESSTVLESVRIISDGSQWYIIDNRGGTPQIAGLVAYWAFSETSGTSASDSSVNSNTGTLTGGQSFATDSVSGNVGNALNFDGSADYISVSDHSSLDLTNTGSFSLWVKADSTAVTLGSVASWTTLTDPGDSSYHDADGSEIDMVIVSGNLYYAAATSSNGTDGFYTSSTALDGSSQSSWTSHGSGVDGGNEEGVSCAIDSDGEKLYFASLGTNDAVETYATANSNLDGSGFSGWTTQSTPNGAGASEKCSTDMVIVNDKMYFVTALIDDATEVLYTASSNLDGTNFSGWSADQGAIGGSNATESYSVGIDSDGEKLYYASFTAADEAEVFGVASSDLDGSNFTSWTSLTAPAGIGTDDICQMSLLIAGNVMYMAIYINLNGNSRSFQTSHCDLQFGSFSGWTTETVPSSSPGQNDNAHAGIACDGKNLYYSAFSTDNNSTAILDLTSVSLSSKPLIFKEDAYELYLSGGGFIFDWDGRPMSSGNLSAGVSTHFVLTYDGTSMKTYVNGSLKRTQTVSTDFSSNANALQIGGTSSYFDGLLDEVKIYDKALTESEVNALFSAGK